VPNGLRHCNPGGLVGQHLLTQSRGHEDVVVGPQRDNEQEEHSPLARAFLDLIAEEPWAPRQPGTASV
jgi:hypothetical protein